MKCSTKLCGSTAKASTRAHPATAGLCAGCRRVVNARHYHHRERGTGVTVEAIASMLRDGETIHRRNRRLGVRNRFGGAPRSRPLTMQGHARRVGLSAGAVARCLARAGVPQPAGAAIPAEVVDAALVSHPPRAQRPRRERRAA